MKINYNCNQNSNAGEQVDCGKRSFLYSVIYGVAAFTFYQEAADMSNISKKMLQLCVAAHTYYQDVE